MTSALDLLVRLGLVATVADLPLWWLLPNPRGVQLPDNRAGRRLARRRGSWWWR